MSRRPFCSYWIVPFVAIGLAFLGWSDAQAQFDGGGTGGGTGGLGTVGSAGVVVDANGVLRMKRVPASNPQLAKQRLAAALARLNPEIRQPSKLRKVSLTRLEAVIADRLARNEGVTDDMKYLAGLTRIQFVFYYPETKDIVIAGPAEGYAPNLSGRVVGIATGSAVLHLEDLVVALRCFPPGGKPTDLIGVSIDPTKEGLARMQQFLRSIAGRVRPRDATRIAVALRRSLGMQVVTINGVPPNTHFAQVLTEADYRMKLIGIGRERPPVRIESYVSRANPRDVSRNALQRWYFTPNYECVRVSDDSLAMELVGEGVKLVSERELVMAGGGRVASKYVDRASEAFVRNFTQMYPLLAKKSPVYGQLRNLIDLAIVAAYLQEQDYYNQAGWNMPIFGDEQRFPVRTYATPKQVESAVNVVWKGNTLMTPIGGGVNIKARAALASNHLLKDDKAQLQGLRSEIQLKGLPAGRWWWD